MEEKAVKEEVKKESNENTKNEVEKKEVKKELSVLPKDFSDLVYNTLVNYQDERGLVLPKGYQVGNALRSAWLKITDGNLLKDVSQQSVANSLISMATLGLNPARNQCYFVKMGNKLTMLPSYFGKISAIKRIHGVKDVIADVIYKDTKYELNVNDYGLEEIRITTPCPLDKRKNENVEGAWACIILDKDVFPYERYYTLMTIEDIRNAWGMGSSYGKSKAHNNFTNEMAKKTAINRATKMFVDTMTDDGYFVDAFVQSVSDEYEYSGFNDEGNDVFVEKTVSAKDVEEERIVVGMDDIVAEEEQKAKQKQKTQKKQKVEPVKKEEPKQQFENLEDDFDDLDTFPDFEI